MTHSADAAIAHWAVLIAKAEALQTVSSTDPQHDTQPNTIEELR
ncbi:hypothetical protein A3Q41_05035 (plasmid) [Rhodococcoides fascians]|uniref:Uncharacterized protein n=1 Tax=Rhodococcoides fascians TaxID=1828 RepID=A0A143QTF7_RHOFA|nr:hypothetical protein A3Q41_05035 [Rhodococcus fascians]